LLGRQHAGETPSSHILQAMVEELLLPTPENEFLLPRYNFYLFPMVNVDGVVLGNYRCNFHGLDLNRCWQL
jgi:murein tripeptide amidase MpaA